MEYHRKGHGAAYIVHLECVALYLLCSACTEGDIGTRKMRMSFYFSDMLPLRNYSTIRLRFRRIWKTFGQTSSGLGTGLHTYLLVVGRQSHKRSMILLEAPTGTLHLYYKDITKRLCKHVASKKYVIIMERSLEQDSNAT